MKKYFDACALEYDSSVIAIANSSIPSQCITTHLAIGEALANIILKKKGEVACQKFIALLITLHKQRKLEIIQQYDKLNGGTDIFAEVREEFPRLSLTDAVHLVTAIREQCSEIVTTDPDFIGNRRKIELFTRERGTELGIREI